MKIDWHLFIFITDPPANGGLEEAEAMDLRGIAATLIDPPAEE